AQGDWIDCPLFCGDDIEQWIHAIESFLHRFQIPIEQHVNIASHHIVGVASKWVMKNENFISWGNWSQFYTYKHV
ncbi:hypothetical protein ABFV55_27915, partial [Pseudomonas syringae]|uniref:hypothetical protein n=1 Tax=Pseudomonas syringae TaxID=317 RepID=UPI0034D96BAE